MPDNDPCAWFPELCEPGIGVPLSAYCRVPPGLYTMECARNGAYTPGGGGGTILPPAVIASPSTVWTGTGTYSRTLQAILSGLGLLRGAQSVPTATQFIQAPSNQGGYGYGGQVPAGYAPASGGGNLAGSLQRTIEKYPGTVAIVGAVGAALVIGKLVGGSKSRRYA